MIRPFWDRLDIQIPYIWYAVPWTNPAGPTNVFTDRFWDQRDHWWNSGVGVVPNTQRPYFGKVPSGEITPLIGSRAQWVDGISHADFIAGRIPPGPLCVQIPDKVKVVRIRQAQAIGPPIAALALVEQVQLIDQPLCGYQDAIAAVNPQPGETIPLDPTHEYTLSFFFWVSHPYTLFTATFQIDGGAVFFADTTAVECADSFSLKYRATWTAAISDCPVVGATYALHLHAEDTSGRARDLTMPFATRWFDAPFISQAQAVPYGLAPPALVRQAQQVRAGFVQDVRIAQAQRVTAGLIPEVRIAQAQDVSA